MISAGAAAVVVAAIIVPVAVVLNGGAERTAPPIDRPSSGSSHRIPAGFPLVEGWPAPTTSTPEGGVVGPDPRLEGERYAPCGRAVDPPQVLDRTLAYFHEDDQTTRDRELKVFAEPRVARTYGRALSDAYRGCREADGSAVHISSVTPLDLGDVAWTVLTRVEEDGLPAAGLEVMNVVVVGNAVLLDGFYRIDEIGDPARQSLLDAQVASMAAMAQSPVVAMCVFSIAGCATSPTAADSSQLLSADLVPARARLEPWVQVQAEGHPTLDCQGAPLDTLGAQGIQLRDFQATIAGDIGGVPASAVHTAVLTFVDSQGAHTAYDTVAQWIADCPMLPGDDRGPGTAVDQVTRATPAGGRSEWRQWDFFATDICTDCDAVRFNRMGVAEVEERLVLVSLAEVGGPLQPTGLDRTMSALMSAAVTQSRP